MVFNGDVRYSSGAEPAISPDGAFVVYLADQDRDTVEELYAAPIAGGTGAHKLNRTPIAGRLVDFRISPDSRWVVYRAYQDDAQKLELFAVAPDGARLPRRLNPALPPEGDVGATLSCFHGYCGGDDIHRDAFEITADSQRVVFWADAERDEHFSLFSVLLASFRGESLGRAADPVLRLSPSDCVTTEFRLDPATGRAVFQKELSGWTSPLFSSPVDRSEPVRIDGGEQSHDFFLAPVGGRVAYTGRDGTLHVAPVEASHPSLDLGLRGDEDACFTADGERILLRHSEFYPFGERVLSVRADGTDLVAVSSYQTDWFDLQTRATRTTYVGGGRLYSAPLDGSASEVRLDGALATGPVVGAVREFQISSTGRFVVYCADQDTDEAFELYRVELFGARERRRLTPAFLPGRAVVAAGFAITPDSERVLYVADEDTNDQNELFCVAADGSEAPVKVSGALIAAGDVRTSLATSPDGRWVVYLADAEVDDRVELYSAPTDGSAPPRKLNGPLVLGGDVQENVGFRISPDGAWVVYRADQEFDRQVELNGVPIDASLPARKLNAPLAGLTSVELDFQIAANSSRVVYRAWHAGSGSTRLHAVPIAGGAPVELSHALTAGHRVLDFLLTPHGARAVYVSNARNSINREITELYSVPLDRSEPPVRLSAPQPLGGGPMPNDSLTTGFRIFGGQVVFRADNETPVCSSSIACRWMAAHRPSSSAPACPWERSRSRTASPWPWPATGPRRRPLLDVAPRRVQPGPLVPGSRRLSALGAGRPGAVPGAREARALRRVAGRKRGARALRRPLHGDLQRPPGDGRDPRRLARPLPDDLGPAAGSGHELGQSPPHGFSGAGHEPALTRALVYPASAIDLLSLLSSAGRSRGSMSPCRCQPRESSQVRGAGSRRGLESASSSSSSSSLQRSGAFHPSKLGPDEYGSGRRTSQGAVLARVQEHVGERVAHLARCLERSRRDSDRRRLFRSGARAC
jgi:Tol biopolymer transport system component